MQALPPVLSCSAQSPAHRVALVELYTSEGCSSCPPADRWLAKAWPTVRFDQSVPLALHVNYWDYIGWKDIYADAQFTERQRAFAALRSSPTVYTPQILVQGQDERGGHHAVFKTITTLNSQNAAYKLSVSARSNEVGLQVYLQTDPLAATGATPKVFLALTHSGLASKVTRGENAGETLRHDHVVRRYSGALDPGLNGRLIHRFTLPADSSAPLTTLRIAAWVESAPSRIEQVTGCTLAPSPRP